ncbi:MAG: hypothetical protein Fur0020_03130 [Thermodesulfovibrionia bacterium]
MQRLDVRCKVDLPVTIISSDKGLEERKARFAVLSLSGGLIESPSYLPEKGMVYIRYELPRYGEFEIVGEILRRQENGFATRFCSLNRDAKLKLWQYLRENLRIQQDCPYCGQGFDRAMRRCNSCGLSLNFDSPDYLIEHEKETFLKRLERVTKTLSIEDIYKILNFVDVEILKVGRRPDTFEEFIGSCPQMLDVFSMIRRVAPLDVPVLIRGDKGTGKEFTARAIHERSKRRDKPFISINCSDIPEDVLERELFGDTEQSGNLKYAEGGTVLLKEIGHLPSGLQTRIYELLSKRANIRLLFSTSMELKPLINSGLFSKDLYNQIAQFVIYLPPVSKRGDDRIILARYFLNRFSREIGGNKRFSEEAVHVINTYDWPGNVKEIINRVRRAIMLSRDETITADDMGLKVPSDDTELSIRAVRNEVEKQKLIEAMNRFNNNISRAAKALGVSRPTVYKMKRKYGI